MSVGSSSMAAVMIASVSLMGIAALAGLTRNFAPFVDELLPTTGCTIGMPRLITVLDPVEDDLRRLHGRASLGLHPMSDLLSRVRLPTFSDRFRVLFFMPTCRLGAPNITSGQQATCSPYAFGLSVFPLPVSGSGYKAGDNLTMNPRTGLNCPIYPVLSVKAVDATGALISLVIFNPGMCLVFPTTGTYSFSGGSGTGYSMPAGKNGVRWSIDFAKVPAVLDTPRCQP